ncbi:hypothetical protein M3Y95_00065300 [Aphelenchoides besseyi]|nr:hypothetical protein M3Y95_00065300 [Aphelenchoides besseyi]
MDVIRNSMAYLARKIRGSNSRAVRELKETPTTENRIPKNDRNFMGKFLYLHTRSTYSIDGRFVLLRSNGRINMIDLFHTQMRTFHIDVSSATVEGCPLAMNVGELWIHDVFALDVVENSNYLGIGNIDFEHSVVIVKQTVAVPVNDRFLAPKWFPQSYPPDLYKGVIIGLHDDDNNIYNYFVVQIGSDDHFRLFSIDFPLEMIAFGYFDGFFCGIVFEQTGRYMEQTKSIDLVKYSISTGERTQEQTINWEIIEFSHSDISRRFSPDMCRVGRTLFVLDFSKKENEFKIISFDLDSLEWQRSSFPGGNKVHSLLSDGERTLLCCTSHFNEHMRSYNRFVLNEPDKLSNLVWLRLKRIFDARPTSYEFILSQLPTNFKPKCPFQPS